MDAEKYNRQISLICPTCGGAQFQFDDEVPSDERIYKCVNCNRELTKDELMGGNGENIAVHQQELVEEIKKDISKEVYETLKKAFRGSKHIKFK